MTSKNTRVHSLVDVQRYENLGVELENDDRRNEYFSVRTLKHMDVARWDKPLEMELQNEDRRNNSLSVPSNSTSWMKQVTLAKRRHSTQHGSMVD